MGSRRQVGLGWAITASAICISTLRASARRARASSTAASVTTPAPADCSFNCRASARASSASRVDILKRIASPPQSRASTASMPGTRCRRSTVARRGRMYPRLRATSRNSTSRASCCASPGVTNSGSDSIASHSTISLRVISIPGFRNK
ncbi:MAG: hypothetical protein M5U25_13710 [Planctomycetota bacterium]|nr:hypothetical protein [Planctomycetota bacterium]